MSFEHRTPLRYGKASGGCWTDGSGGAVASSCVDWRSKRPEILWTQSRWNVLLCVQVRNMAGRDAARFSENTVSFR